MTATHTRTRTLEPGDPVVMRLVMPGGWREPRYAGELRGFVLNAGAEIDVIISPAEYSTPERDEDMRTICYDAGIEDEDWIREGAVLVIRNLQPFDVRHEDSLTYPPRQV